MHRRLAKRAAEEIGNIANTIPPEKRAAKRGGANLAHGPRAPGVRDQSFGNGFHCLRNGFAMVLIALMGFIALSLVLQ